MTAQPHAIDFIADVVCPWCYIGWRRLEKALAERPEVEAKVTWRPYQLDPTLPEEGVDRHAYMAAKFPDAERRKAMGEALAAQAAQDGIVMKLNDIAVSPNTNAAHRLIRWAQGQGLQTPVIEGVLKAYFEDGRDIGDPVVLADIGAAAGMDRILILDLFSQGVDKDAVTREYAMAANGGVTGVPFTIINGRLAVSGAQDVERMVMAVDKAASLAASEPARGGD